MRLVYLSGGVGGARLVRGLAAELAPNELTTVVNIGDDFDHWGLRICPDLDTVMYTLAGLSHPTRGWGLAEESFKALGMVTRLGGETWFGLSDQDLGTHMMRTQWLRGGTSLTEVTRRLCEALGVSHPVLPMADAPLSTVIETDTGERLPFQVWFVQRRAAPPVAKVHFVHEAETAGSGGRVVAAIERADAVLIGPSNPYVSIDPILAVPNVREAVAQRPVFAVSPILGTRAVKGPLAGMITQLTGQSASAGAIASHYLPRTGLAGMIVEAGDEPYVQGVPVCGTQTLMRTPADSQRLARACLAFMAGAPQ